MMKENEKGIPINQNSDLYFFSEEKYIQRNPDKFSEEREVNFYSNFLVTPRRYANYR